MDPLMTQPARAGKSYVELNRYAVGVGEWIGVGTRLVSCECDGLAGSGYIGWSEENDLRLPVL